MNITSRDNRWFGRSAMMPAAPTRGRVGADSLTSTRERVARLALALLLVTTLILVARIVVAYQFPCGLVRECPYASAVAVAMHRTPVLGRGGEVVGTVEGGARYYPLYAFDPLIVEAFVIPEDRRFAHREGAWDGRSLLRGILSTLGSLRLVGGISTIPMQAARTLLADTTTGAPRTILGKAREMGMASELVERYGRRRVLELYLNIAPLGRVRGVPAAAREYFGHADPAGLSLAEAAWLAGALPAPSRIVNDAADAERRRLRVLGKMQALLPDSAAPAIDAARRAHVRPIAQPARTTTASADFLARLRPFASSARTPVRSTLDARLQAIAAREVERQIARLESGSAHAVGSTTIQACFVAMDSHSGEVMAWVAGRPDRDATFDHCAIGNIRPGSTLKPLLLAEAVDAGWLSGRERVSDVERVAGASARAEHWLSGLARHSARDASIPRALARSDNYLGALLGLLVQPRLDRLRRVSGVALPAVVQTVDALGTGTMHPVDLVRLYAALDNDGRRVDARFTRPGPGERHALDRRAERAIWKRDAARAVRDALRAVTAPGGTGQGAGAGTPSGMVSGGKTGTVGARKAKNSELLFVGYYGSMTALLWMGCDRECPVFGAHAGQVVVPLWATIFAEYAHGARARPT